jgi:hypothetical protein
MHDFKAIAKEVLELEAKELLIFRGILRSMQRIASLAGTKK